MRQNTNNFRRPRSRPNNFDRRPTSRNQVFDSNGPEVRVRGSASQIAERYQTLARDATASGDRVKSENYRQHAEHYLRTLNSADNARRKDIDRGSDEEDYAADQGSPSDSNSAPPRGRRNYPVRPRSGGGDSSD